MMRLTLISDTHCTQPALPSGDVLIHCGDLTHYGEFSELKEQVAWLKSLPFKYIVLISGNHDVCCETLMNKGMEAALREKLFGRIRYLRDSGVTLEGVRFWGAPWVPPYAGAFNLDAHARASRWKLIPQDTDVLITHCPPHGVLDGGAGCKHLMDAVREIKPAIHCFGHFHACGGNQQEIGSTTFLNVAKSAQVLALSDDGKGKKLLDKSFSMAVRKD